MESVGPKILFWEWVVKGEFAFPRCDMSLAKIDHFHLKSAILVRIYFPSRKDWSVLSGQTVFDP